MMRIYSRICAGGCLVIVLVLGISAARGQLPPDCYGWPPVAGDCVTTQPGDVFCHYHFQVVTKQLCDTDGRSSCLPHVQCEPCGQGRYCKTANIHNTMVTYYCKDTGRCADTCFYCAALLICDAGYVYDNASCAGAPVDRYFNHATNGCRAY